MVEKWFTFLLQLLLLCHGHENMPELAFWRLKHMEKRQLPLHPGECINQQTADPSYVNSSAKISRPP